VNPEILWMRFLKKSRQMKAKMEIVSIQVRLPFESSECILLLLTANRMVSIYYRVVQYSYTTETWKISFLHMNPVPCRHLECYLKIL